MQLRSSTIMFGNRSYSTHLADASNGTPGKG